MNASLSPVGRHFSGAGLAVVIGLHALVFGWLLQQGVIKLAAADAVLTVALLPRTEPVVPKAMPQPTPQPTPPRPRVTPTPPRLAVPEQTAAPSPQLVAAAAPAPVVSAPASAAPAVAAPPAPAPAVAPTPPRFDANYLDNPRPAYPAVSRRLGEEGKVVLRVLVEADGRAGDVQLHNSSGSPRLDQAALDTVRRWQFVAAKLGQEAVAAWVLVPIAFTLKD